MKVLLDVCTPVQVRDALHGHEVHTAARMGWRELENGELLRVAEDSGFHLLIICDKNLRPSANLTGRKLAILELWTNHRPTLEKHGRTSDRTLKRCGPVSIAHFKRLEWASPQPRSGKAGYLFMTKA
jgi:hypothetical protein